MYGVPTGGSPAPSSASAMAGRCSGAGRSASSAKKFAWRPKPLHLSGDWAPTAIGGEEHGISLGNYAEFTHHSDHGDITILVQSDTPATDDLAQQIVQNTLNHGQG